MQTKIMIWKMEMLQLKAWIKKSLLQVEMLA